MSISWQLVARRLTRQGSTVSAVRAASLAATGAAAIAVCACTSTPPTITPVPEAAPAPTAATGSSVTIPVNPGPGGAQGAVAGPVTIGDLVNYQDPEGKFSLNIPQGWVGQPQDVSQGDVKAGMLFAPEVGTGLITITQFDNGQRPTELGSTANQVLEMSGVTKLPSYQELSRSSVLEREGDAMRTEIVYQRSAGEQMHSLVLFQIDGTTFSMVNVGVEQGSWDANSSAIHHILESYRVPAAP